MANLVKNGHADQAAAAFELLKKQYASGGHSLSGFTSQMDIYDSALKDAAFEQQLAADSMGLFGAQAQEVQKKLSAQKQTADGLRQSIQALNDVNRQAAGGQIAMEAAIDAANKAAKENGKTLDVNTEGGRGNRSALLDLASTTDDYTAKLLDQNASWDAVNAAAQRGRDNLIATAMRMGANATEAKKLADQYLKIPSQVKTFASFLKADAESALASMKKKLASYPNNKKTRASFEYKQAAADVRYMQQLVDRMHGNTVTVKINGVSTGVNAAQYYAQGPGKAMGGRISGPGSGTSDDVPIMASNGEYVVNAAATAKNLALLEAINAGKVRAFASGGKVTAAEQQARNSAMGSFGVSYFGQKAGYHTTGFEKAVGAPASVGDLVSSLNQWRSNIKAATSGLTEKGLLSAISKAGGQLLKQEKALTKVNSALDSAKTKLTSLRDAASQLSDSVKSGIMSGGNITKAAGNGNITAQDVVGQLAGSRDNAKALDDALKKLRARGLNSQSLSEIAAAGVDGGGLQTASALLAGSASQIKQINSLEKQLTASATEAGKVTAGAMYDASIKAADKVVKGLVSQQQKLEKSMDRIAKSLEKAISKAFKGHASGGVAGGVSWINEQGPELVRLPQGSMVYPAGQSQQMAAGGGGGSQPLQITLVLGGEHLGEILIDPLRKSVSSRGGNVQAVLGRK